MTDIYLKAPTIEDFYNELGEPFVREIEYAEDGELKTKKIFTTEKTHACSYVGTIVDEEGIYDEEGNELKAPTFVDGVHLNIRLLEDMDLPEFTNVEQVTPNSPSRVWA
jgi:hypothetical protein